MSHTVEKLSSNKVKISFSIPAASFDEALQKAYLKMRGRINVPGFRKGKAPRALIERMYGEGVFYDEAFELLFPAAYEAAVTENALLPVDRPSVDVSQIGKGEDLTFTAEVYVRPEVTLGDYKNLEVTVHKHPVTDEMVTEKIEQDRERTSRMIDVEDRPVENGDTVALDYAGSVDGVAFDGGTAEGQTLVIGSNRFIPGFEEQMIGMNIEEERDLHVTFPTEYHAEELAGKEAVFHVKLHNIQKKELPELDDEFAMDVSDFNTFEEYKADIRKKLEEEEDKRVEVETENAIVEKAVANATMEIPEAMIEDQIDYILRDMRLRMAYQGLKFEDYLKYTGQSEEQMRQMYHGEAENRVKMELALEAIRKAEAIEPSQEEIDKQIAQQAERSGEDVEKFRERLTDRQKELMADSAAIQMVVDLMKASAKVTYDVHDPHDHNHDHGSEGTEESAEKAEKKPAKKAAKPRKKKEEAPKEEA